MIINYLYEEKKMIIIRTYPTIHQLAVGQNDSRKTHEKIVALMIWLRYFIKLPNIHNSTITGFCSKHPQYPHITLVKKMCYKKTDKYMNELKTESGLTL